MKTVVVYYAGHTSPLQPFIDVGLCPAPPTGKGKLEELTYLPEWDCTQFRDNFAAYCLYFRLNNLFVSSATNFQWKAPVVQGMLSDAPKLWLLTKGSEHTTWMQTNSEKLMASGWCTFRQRARIMYCILPITSTIHLLIGTYFCLTLND